MDSASIRSLAGVAQFEFIQARQTPVGERMAHSMKLSSEGLTAALDRLIATRSRPKLMATPSAHTLSVKTPLVSHDSAAK
jgi:hypothetical protein